MGFYDTEGGVKEYVEMAEGYDGAELVEVLKKHLPEGSTVLELGMGPGKDLALISRSYTVTGSDSSAAFSISIDERTARPIYSCSMPEPWRRIESSTAYTPTKCCTTLRRTS